MTDILDDLTDALHDFEPFLDPQQLSDNVLLGGDFLPDLSPEVRAFVYASEREATKRASISKFARNIVLHRVARRQGAYTTTTAARGDCTFIAYHQSRTGTTLSEAATHEARAAAGHAIGQLDASAFRSTLIMRYQAIGIDWPGTTACMEFDGLGDAGLANQSAFNKAADEIAEPYFYLEHHHLLLLACLHGVPVDQFLVTDHQIMRVSIPPPPDWQLGPLPHPCHHARPHRGAAVPVKGRRHHGRQPPAALRPPPAERGLVPARCRLQHDSAGARGGAF